MHTPLRGHNHSTISVAFSPDGSKIISGSEDIIIRVWDASSIGIETLQPLQGHDDWIQSVVFSLDGSEIISGSDDKTIRVWDASTGVEMLPPLRGHHNPIDFVGFSPDGSKIISGSDDNTIRVWDANTGVLLPEPQLVTDDTRKPTRGEPMMGGWLTDINTGSILERFPLMYAFTLGNFAGLHMSGGRQHLNS